MIKITPESWKADMPAFKAKAAAFYQGELDKNIYKGFSGLYGSYAQKGGQASMLRLRMTGGRINKDKLKFITDSIRKYNIDKVHFTTCQTVQLHNLGLEALCDIMENALDHGIVTMGGGGDFPRNVMVSPLSGIEAGEYFDVWPYAKAAGDYLMTFIKKEKMPRKLKVCFSNGPANETHATFRDLGFAAREDGFFDVYSAGGLGNNPKLGIKVAEKIDPSKILYYIHAMRDTFIAYGNYEQRGKARTRYMRDVLGDDGYKAAFLEKLALVMASGENLDIQIENIEVQKEGRGIYPAHERVIAQKQSGLYAVGYHPIGGSPNPAKLAEIYDVIKDMDEVELRLAPDETMYIINLCADEVKAVLDVTDDSACSLLESSVACIGAAVCQVGVRDSQGLLKAIIQAVRNAQIPDGALPLIHISGCPSSCGTHQAGIIGFHGCVKMIDKKPQPAYTLHVNGCEVQGEEKLGSQMGVILEKDIPSFMVELGNIVKNSGMRFEQWIMENQETLFDIANKYIEC